MLRCIQATMAVEIVITDEALCFTESLVFVDKRKCSSKLLLGKQELFKKVLNTEAQRPQRKSAKKNSVSSVPPCFIFYILYGTSFSVSRNHIHYVNQSDALMFPSNDGGRNELTDEALCFTESLLFVDKRICSSKLLLGKQESVEKDLKHRGTETTEKKRDRKLCVLCASVFIFL